MKATVAKKKARPLMAEMVERGLAITGPVDPVTGWGEGVVLSHPLGSSQTRSLEQDPRYRVSPCGRRHVIVQRADEANPATHPVRVRILEVMSDGEQWSPVRLAERLGLPVNQVSYHTRRLHGQDAIELVRTEPRRGAVEHFYRRVA